MTPKIYTMRPTHRGYAPTKPYVRGTKPSKRWPVGRINAIRWRTTVRCPECDLTTWCFVDLPDNADWGAEVATDCGHMSPEIRDEAMHNVAETLAGRGKGVARTFKFAVMRLPDPKF